MTNFLPDTGSDVRFAHLRIQDWRQFGEVDIEFHRRLTVLTGANATGKSTILGLLAVHFDWTRTYSSAPISRPRQRSRWSVFGRRRRPDLESNRIGELRYSNGESARIQVPNEAEPTLNRSSYNIEYANRQAVTGSFLTSHRSVPGNYINVPSIPTSFASSGELLNAHTNEMRTQWQGGWSGKSPQQAFKEALIAAAVFGQPGSESLEYNADAAQIWSGYQEVLRSLLPPTLEFRNLRIRVPDVVVVSGTGDFLLDDASGGMVAIMEMAWQVFLRSRSLSTFTVLLDEPENHLHPSLQREMLPGFLRAFPKVHFIVATHSPFVVTATPDSRVYALEYDPQRQVFARELDYANKAASADETLRRVLGVSSTMPSWAEARFDDIVRRYLGRGLSQQGLAAMRAELEEAGLESEFPDAVLDISDSIQRSEPDA